MKKDLLLINLVVPILAILAALVLGAILLLFINVNPLEAYSVLLFGNLTSLYGISEILVKAVPIIMTGLAFTFAYRTGLFNIGAEGQMYVGAIAAVVVGLKLGHLSPFLAIPLSLLAALIAGGIWGGIPGLLKAVFGSSEIIITIMLNYVAVYLLSYLVDKPLREKSGFYPQTDMIGENAFLPVLIPNTRLHLGFLIALLFVVLVYIILWRTKLGFELRAVGLNLHAAEYAGIDVRTKMFLALALSGALAGVAGFTEVGGIHHRLLDNFSKGVGFDGIAVALLGQATPFGVVLASLLFGLLQVGANSMQRSVGVPANIVYIIQGLIILFLLGGTILARRYQKKKAKGVA
ncbi:simple sugar transport system permease protein [Carboxydothermus islandicus]|uniref:Simple sugar transport system permease protein n=1 Tax=Carboxydothermus islandicus TaxID=661089 RepID=A0A1L8CZD1_9THEO|nr:ABC transporter permease [Carboxydothermus islandicus]GAV24247.1 simple sugar transport system permease protein [Carboxydothermus islandicus]